MTPSLSTSRTASIWDSHSGFSILIESPVVTDISCPEQKKRVEATDSRERHFWRRDLGGPCGKGLKIRPAESNWRVSPSAQTISGSGCEAGIFSVQEISPEAEDSGSESILELVRFRRIMRAAFSTMRVNQVVKAERPSKLRRCI